VRDLPSDALIVFVSDSHIGGDPGCDGFESPDELEALFVELSGTEGPVELVLAGDFFDFLQIGAPANGLDRASTTTRRPEYASMFAALRRFGECEGKRIVYLPGNHDAESWWNPRVQDSLRKQGLVHEFAFSYAATFEVAGRRRVVYCEHGNQLDPPNTVDDYTDPLDTPLGHHVVTDFTRRIAPLGEVAPGLDLAEIKMVYPLVAIPRWIAGRYFYNFLGKLISYLLLPLLVLYLVYRILAYGIAVSSGNPRRFFGAYSEFPRVHELFLDIGGFAVVILLLFAIFFLVIRRSVRRTVANLNVERNPRSPSPAEASREEVRAILRGESPPMDRSVRGEEVDVFVSGHTHLPSLERVERQDRASAVAVNSGCWLRQLQPVRARFGGLPVFVSRFVLTHVRVYAHGGEVVVELWEQPKPARSALTRVERLFSWGRLPEQPAADAPARIRNAASVQW
jgi:UDP-2,3-diacylglucosamine pyrophosphatase LpxH